MQPFRKNNPYESPLMTLPVIKGPNVEPGKFPLEMPTPPHDRSHDPHFNKKKKAKKAAAKARRRNR